MRERRADAMIALLAVGSGSVNALSFSGLSGVFTSVMTGNMVLLGIAAVRLRADVALHSLAAIIAYTTGVYAAARWLGAAGVRRVRSALAAVAVLQGATLACWAGVTGRPGPPLQVTLVAVAALAMGVQSGAVNVLPVTGAATTYLTGTLTALASGRTRPRRIAVLAAALGGAAADTLLLAWARPTAPALPLAATVAAILVIGRASPPPAR